MDPSEDFDFKKEVQEFIDNNLVKSVTFQSIDSLKAQA